MSMTLKPYDKAVVGYFKEVFPNTVYAPTDLAMKKSAEDNNGKVRLPLISVFRTPTISIGDNENVNQRGFRRGAPLRNDPEALSVERVRLKAVKLEYQVDIWTSSVEEVTAMFAEIVFLLEDFPAYEVELANVPNKLSHVLEVMDVVDNTDLLEESDRGRLGRMSIILSTEAYIAKFSSTKSVLSVPVETEMDFPNSTN